MNKLYTSLIYTLIFTPYIFSMHTITELSPIPESFSYDMKKKILLEHAENIHLYVYDKPEETRITIACQTIRNISFVNKELYKSLDKQRNDGPTARTIITNIRTTYEDSFRLRNAKQFCFPGAKKCFEISKKLYNEDLNPDMVEILLKEGAIIDFSITASQEYQGLLMQSPLKHWTCITRKNKQQKKQIITKLLECGANPNVSDPLSYTITTSQPSLTKLILQYNPLIGQQAWHDALFEVSHKNTSEYLNLLLQHAKQNELDAGLIACFKYYYDHNNEDIKYQPNVMQKFIDHGADMTVALQELTKILPNMHNNNPILNNIIFFCEKGAFNKITLTKLREMEKLFGDMANLLEKNNKQQPLRQKSK